MLRRLILVAVTTLVACSPPLQRLPLAPVTSQLELRPLVGSVMIRPVTLPTYAAAEEIAFEGPGGLISTNDDILWADDPTRAVSLALIRNLKDILDINVGPDPWPFLNLPDVTVEVQVERMIAGSDGIFYLTGQFFVGGDAIDFRDSTHDFNINQTITDQGLNSITTAQAQALLTLSEEIAQTLGR